VTRFSLVPLVVGVALAVAGVLLLLRNLGVLPPGVTIWPVLVIAAGLVLLLVGLREQGTDAPLDAAATPLDGATEARLVLKHGAGLLDVTGGARAGQLFEGTFAGGVRQELARHGGRLEATLRHPPDPDRLVRQSRGLRWTVAVTPEVPLDLELQTGAARAQLDCTGTRLRELRVQTGASEVDIRLPAAGRTTVRVSAGAADIRLHVPEGVAAAITNRSALASVSVDQARFPAWGKGYRSPDYESAEHRVDIDLEGGVASFRVD
jgi:hypothetical protein